MGHGSISTLAPISASPDGLRIGFHSLWSSGRGTGKTRGAAEITNRVVKKVPEIALVGRLVPPSVKS